MDNIYNPEDLIQLSALQHYTFCPRQCALIHIEQIWSENLFTAEGRIMHEKVDTANRESRGNVRIEYGVPMRSFRLGLIGKADVVEFHRSGDRWVPFPVEYKRGKPKSDNCDKVQLCAQAICLEEMLNVEIKERSLFYGQTWRRGDVVFDNKLRTETEKAAKKHSITRCCVTTEKERDDQAKKDREFASTFGRKATVPYALYRMHGFISAVDARKTKFSEEDLKLLWESLVNAFEHDRAAARGEMNPRKLVIFKHSSHLGNELSGRLFERVTVKKNTDLPRGKEDYSIVVDKQNLPSEIEIKEWPEEDVF